MSVSLRTVINSLKDYANKLPSEEFKSLKLKDHVVTLIETRYLKPLEQENLSNDQLNFLEKEAVQDLEALKAITTSEFEKQV